MATVREGKRDVVLVVDFQNGVVASAWDREAVAAHIRTVVAKARAAGVPVVWVRHADEELVPGSPEWEIDPSLRPGADEPRIEKKFNSSFEETGLENLLAGLGATRIVLMGAVTNFCIRSTAYAAVERGYDLALVGDAHTTDSKVLPDGSVIEARDVIRDMNRTIRWMSYPGRKNETVGSDELAFD